MDDPRDKHRSFEINESSGDSLIFAPEDVELNWSTDPLPPPRASYKRDPDTVSDDEAGVSSDWNFVLPTY